MKYLLHILALLAVVAIAACTTHEPQSENRAASPTVPAQRVEDTVATTNESSTVEIEVTAKQWEFIPNPIIVKEGDNVRLKVTSIDVAHGIAIPDFGINEFLSPGKTTEVEFIADKAGTYPFFCSVQCGAGHGNMRGTLIVE